MGRFGILLVLFTICNLSFAQSYLELRKIGNVKGRRFYVGEEIRFKQKGQDGFTRGLIVDFPNDSTIRFYKGYFDIRDIAEVDIRKKLKGWEWNLVVAGVAYVGLDRLNSRLQNRSSQSNRALWVPAGVLVGSGLLIRLIKPKKFKVGSRRKLYITKVNLKG